MHSLWDPISLAFPDAHLEQRFSHYRAASAFAEVDRWFAYFGMLSNLFVALLEFYRGRQLGFLVTSLVNGCCGASMAVALRRENREWFLKHRTEMVLGLRTVRIASGICAYHLFPWDVPGITLLMRTVVFALFCTYWTCGMPLNFKIHAMHHSIALALVFLLLQKPFCGRQHSDPWFSAFNFLNFSQDAEMHLEEQCRRALLSVFFVLGSALPMMILWVMELMSRHRFMALSRIPVETGLGKRYFMTLLIWAFISIWILVALS